MKKSELLALLAKKGDDEEIGELKTETNPESPVPNPGPKPNPVPNPGPKPNPVPNPAPKPNPLPKPNEIKADTIISGTASELIQLFAPMFKKEEPKKEEPKSAAVYID